MESARIFRPRSFVVGLVSSVVLLGAISAVIARTLMGPGWSWWFSWMPWAFGAAVLFFAVILPTMRYSVGATDLMLSCGPFSWSIPLDSIRSSSEAELGYLPWSEGWKLPGYALFSMRFKNVGPVRMCATALTTRIVLVQTDSATWGVTPDDVPAFLAAIGPKRAA